MRLAPLSRGQLWTAADDAQLLALFDAKVERALIAHQLGRTQAAVETRFSTLKKLRLLELGLMAKGK